jgi:hypothetical protein
MLLQQHPVLVSGCKRGVKHYNFCLPLSFLPQKCSDNRGIGELPVRVRLGWVQIGFYARVRRVVGCGLLRLGGGYAGFLVCDYCYIPPQQLRSLCQQPDHSLFDQSARCSPNLLPIKGPIRTANSGCVGYLLPVVNRE